MSVAAHVNWCVGVLTQWTGENLVTTGEIEEIDEAVSRLSAVTAEDVQGWLLAP